MPIKIKRDFPKTLQLDIIVDGTFGQKNSRTLVRLTNYNLMNKTNNQLDGFSTDLPATFTFALSVEKKFPSQKREGNPNRLMGMFVRFLATVEIGLGN